MIIQFDKATLPIDGQKIKFYLVATPEKEFIGEYIEEESMFFVDPLCWFFTQDIAKWEAVK